VNGKLEADFERVSPANPISLSTINGPIKLSIPEASRPNMVAVNLRGGIDTDVGRPVRTSAGHRLLLKGNGAPIHVHNVNGGISIRSQHPLT
jgi:hypothetical protein